MNQAVEHAVADPSQPVESPATRQAERPPRANLEANLEPEAVVLRHGTGYCQRMRTSIDVFAKAREHERVEQLQAARELDLVPYFRVLEGPTLPVVEMEGERRIMLGSNNYLGLTGDERVQQGAMDALNRYGTGITGSRFLNGTTELHLELEAELADWLGTEAAVVFTTGHQANVGALGTILGPGDTVIADSGDHASILDGVLLSQAKLRAFKHNRLDLLERRLESAVSDGGGILVVVDGVFSSEGDVAPLPEIAELCQRFGARLMVDEAHALGVLGARGAGSCELLDVEDRVDLRMATFSKSLASCGGVIAGPADVIDFLRFQARSFIFTASPVPAATGAALAALRICRSPEGPPLFARVLENARYLHRGLDELGLRVVPPTRLADGTEVVTPVVPVMIGDDWKAALIWKALYDAGIYVNVMIHPAVPPGGALLRTSVMATHDEATLDQAIEIFAQVKREFEAEHGPLPGRE
jgi:8-amino-7-oxononanoate synthase